MSDVLLTNIATIVIALFAGMVALYQVKSNIISDARIKWIESLRETLSQYVCELENCSNAKLDLFDARKGKSGKNLEDVLDKFYVPYAAAGKEVSKLQSKTMLYFSSDDPKHKRIEELMLLNNVLVHLEQGDNRAEIRKNTYEIMMISKEIFKTEWQKSKSLFKI